MAKKPPEKPRDSIADAVDKLLEQFPSDPDPDAEDRAESTPLGPAEFLDPDARVSITPQLTRRDKALVWVRVTLAVAIAGAMTQWPYARDCGLPLLGFAAATGIVPAAGVWVSVTGWRGRFPVVHVLGLAVVLWGVALWANLLLPRIGYAETTAGWRCVAPPPPPPVDRASAVSQPDGTVLYTREVGSSGPSIIVPSAGVLDQSFADLGQDLHLIFYDSRHLGRSRAAGTRWGLATDVEDLAAVRWSFVVRDPMLMDSLFMMGWSYMGPVVTQYAIEHPDQVTGLILLGSLPPSRVGYQTEWVRAAGPDTLGLELLRILEARGDDQDDRIEFCRLMWEVAVLRPRMSDPAAIDQAGLDLCSVRTEQYLQWEANMERAVAALGNWDFTGAAQRYPGRVLVIHGSDDPNPIEGGAAWALAFPNARFLNLANAGGLPWLEHPDVVKQAIRTFVSGRWPANAVQVTSGPPTP